MKKPKRKKKLKTPTPEELAERQARLTAEELLCRWCALGHPLYEIFDEETGIVTGHWPVEGEKGVPCGADVEPMNPEMLRLSPQDFDKFVQLLKGTTRLQPEEKAVLNAALAYRDCHRKRDDQGWCPCQDLLQDVTDELFEKLPIPDPI